MKARPKPDWDAHERIRVAEARAIYGETTPGERIERGAALSRQATGFAAMVHRARVAKRSA